MSAHDAEVCDENGVDWKRGEWRNRTEKCRGRPFLYGMEPTLFMVCGRDKKCGC